MQVALTLLAMACHEPVFWMGEGDAEERIKERGPFVCFRLFNFRFVIVMSNSDTSIAIASSSNITILRSHMPMAYHELVFWMGEGDAEERMKERGAFGMF